jgi:hypothetical protein
LSEPRQRADPSVSPYRGPVGSIPVCGHRSSPWQVVEAHGLYWTVSENDPITAPFYNVGKGSQALYRQPQGQKRMAVSVRCVRE